MIKRLLAVLLSLTLIFSINIIALSDEIISDDEGFEAENPEPPSTEDTEINNPFYAQPDENGNYTPVESYYCGRLVALNDSININEITSVTLTSADVSYSAEVDSSGRFSLMIPDSQDAMTVTIPNEKFSIIPDIPVDNNKIFVSLIDNNYKDIYVGIRSNITGTVTNFDGSAKIAKAAVTCYYRATEYDEWSLWMGNEFSPNANKTTDTNGTFSYAITSGQFRFVINADGYSTYDSSVREYPEGILPTSETTNITFHLTADKFMSLQSAVPEQGGVIAPDGSFKLIFSKPVSKSVVSNYDNLRLERVITSNYVPFTATVNGNEVTLKPNSRLIENQKYNLLITQKITSTDGSSLNAERTITFTCQKSSGDEQSTEKNNESNTPASDIEKHWSKLYMERLIALDIIGAAENNGMLNYYPDKPLTRAEFAKYIVMSQNIETSLEESGVFKDSDMIPYELRPYAYGTYNAGLIQGSHEKDGVYFLPNDTISRAEIITILGRMTGDTSDESLDFADAADVPDWAMPYVTGCIQKGYVNGDIDTGVKLLRPLDNVTRCEAATIISKILDDKSAEDEANTAQ